MDNVLHPSSKASTNCYHRFPGVEFLWLARLMNSAIANSPRTEEEAVHECVSEDALVHLKSYKYSSVDNSLLTRYVMRHYVRGLP